MCSSGNDAGGVRREWYRLTPSLSSDARPFLSLVLYVQTALHLTSVQG